MEGKRMGPGSSSSSLVSDLFGRKDSSSSAKSNSGIFGSVFPPPSSVVRSYDSNSTKRASASAAAAAAAVGAKSKSKGNNSFQSKVGNKTDHHPCFLSSSVYYGGQDYYCTQPNLGPNIKNAEPHSDPIDSRGDWWQGSLYY